MPLIMLCGGPLSGKSLITKKIEQKCKELYPDRECQVLSHETLNISRLVFKDMPTEKKFNQKILSLVEQALTSRRVLIVDFICLTKSLRYQLYGKANFIGTVSCVVHCTTPYEVTVNRNKADIIATGSAATAGADGSKKQYYTEAIFEDLWNRLEAPLDTCKWDYPCYPIDCSDLTPFLPQSPTNDDDPNNDLWTKILNSICESSKKALSRANLPTRSESSGFVAVLDKITTAIVEQLIITQQQQGFVVGALLETQSITVQVDISPFLSLSAGEPATPVSPIDQGSGVEILSPQPIAEGIDSLSSATPTSPTSPAAVTSPSSGLKLVRKPLLRGKKPLTTTSTDTTVPTSPGVEQQQQPSSNTKTIYDIFIKNPTTPSQLFELKQSFSRIATMMNVKTAAQMAKAFVEYLQPQLNPM